MNRFIVFRIGILQINIIAEKVIMNTDIFNMANFMKIQRVVTLYSMFNLAIINCQIRNDMIRISR